MTVEGREIQPGHTNKQTSKTFQTEKKVTM